MEVVMILLSVVQLLASLVLFCCMRVLWARLPGPVEITAEEKAEVDAYRAKWKGVVTDEQSDAEVLALARINPS